MQKLKHKIFKYKTKIFKFNLQNDEYHRPSLDACILPRLVGKERRPTPKEQKFVALKVIPNLDKKY